MALLKRKTAAKTIVGLDLDPAHLAAAEVHVNGALAVTRGVVAPLRPGILRDGDVADGAALTDALDELWADSGLSSRVRLGIAHQRIIVRSLDLPVTMDPKALKALVMEQAPDHIPMPMEEAVVDFQSLGVVPTAQGPKSRVAIVAVRRDMIARLARACGDAGLELEGIDLSAFGMVRAQPPAAGTGAALYVNVAGLTNVAVANAAGCLFTRATPGGLDQVVTTLAERSGLTLEHARQWLGHVGFLVPVEDVEGDADLVGAVRTTLEEGVHQVADDVRNSLHFYRAQEGADAVERGLLTGPAVGIPGFAERLSELLRLPIEPTVVAVAAAGADVDPAHLTVAAGLALETPS
jgi:type IV pilus assembly protein PilM